MDPFTWMQGKWRIHYVRRSNTVHFSVPDDPSIGHVAHLTCGKDGVWGASSGDVIVHGYKTDIEAIDAILHKLEMQE